MYVFKKLRKEKEYQGSTFITASFDQRILRTAKLFHPPSEDRSEDPEELSSEQLHMIGTKYPSAIHLYDAAPTKIPDYDAKMITFTSPNENWVKSIRKNSIHRFLYMNSWSLEELQRANNKVLKPKINLPEKDDFITLVEFLDIVWLIVTIANKERMN